MVNIQDEYRIQRAIDKALDEHIIPLVVKLVRDSDVKNNTRIGRAQFSNLQNVTRDTSSIQVILNWIAYQMGRQSAWNNGDFGKTLLSHLQRDGLRNLADRIVNDLDFEQSMRDEIWLRLIRQYVGQLQRAYIGNIENLELE